MMWCDTKGRQRPVCLALGPADSVDDSLGGEWWVSGESRARPLSGEPRCCVSEGEVGRGGRESLKPKGPRREEGR